MEKETINDYISQQLANGISIEDITKSLSANGWDKDAISKAFLFLQTDQDPIPTAGSISATYSTISPAAKLKNIRIIVIVITLTLIISVIGIVLYVILINPKTSTSNKASIKNTNKIVDAVKEDSGTKTVNPIASSPTTASSVPETKPASTPSATTTTSPSTSTNSTPAVTPPCCSCRTN